jgi:molybdate transport system substrate-binding protein
MTRVLVAVLLALAGPVQGGAGPVTVSAAISLTEVLGEVADAYRRAGGGPVTFNFAGSNVLARQILNGAPVDLFVSADDTQMDVVERAGLLAPGTRTVVAANTLVLVAGSRIRAITSAHGLTAPQVRRIAIGDPDGVPAGVYARDYLTRRNLWSALAPKIVPARSVRAALTAVQNGSVDAAFVYATDARIAPGLRVAEVISGPDAPRIVYPAAILRDARHGAAAGRFLSFLQGPETRRILERHGFRGVDRK